MPTSFQQIPKIQCDNFLLVGRRWELDVPAAIDFDNESWADDVRRNVTERGQYYPPRWIDYFIYRRGFWPDLPPLLLGRNKCDNWLLWKATSLGAALIDGSSAVEAIHQSHERTFSALGRLPPSYTIDQVRLSEEANTNFRMAASIFHFRTICDAQWVLTEEGELERAGFVSRLQGALYRLGFAPHAWGMRAVIQVLALRQKCLKYLARLRKYGSRY